MKYLVGIIGLIVLVGVALVAQQYAVRHVTNRISTYTNDQYGFAIDYTGDSRKLWISDEVVSPNPDAGQVYGTLFQMGYEGSGEPQDTEFFNLGVSSERDWEKVIQAERQALASWREWTEYAEVVKTINGLKTMIITYPDEYYGGTTTIRISKMKNGYVVRAWGDNAVLDSIRSIS
jgi:hypothetical protein